MNKTTVLKNKFAGIVAVAVAAVVFAASPARAGDWSFSIGIPGHVCWHEAPIYRHYDYRPGYYYPVYNPVVERDVEYDGHYHRDGTLHTERTVEDRHDSFYSPGRNEAITRPRTTVEDYRGPGYNGERERTSWIGADGRPHSTTVDRVTTSDPWGNTHTDTQVTLKSRKGSDEPQQDVQIKTPGSGKQPKEVSFKHPKANNRN
ncbi:MAG: hypothetical protein KC940_09285 [Candidatus Omnitrophica bacterium]|nr:hypothetical protein [Candidatus Omnitrophota bacterium]